MKLCYVSNIFLNFTLRIHDASDFGIVDLIGRYSCAQNLCHNEKKKYKPDFLHQLPHRPYRIDIASHDNIVACTHILHRSDPHGCLLLHRVNGIPATVMLVISHLSLFVKARRLLCAAVYGFVTKSYWLDTSIVSQANLVNHYLRNY